MNTQKGNTVGGDMSAGDINKSTTTINFGPPKTQLAALVDQLRDEIGKNKVAVEFVESLIDWTTPKKTGLKRNLSDKLKESGKAHMISDALEAKERFAKQLKKTSFNPAAQEIYACILGEIYTMFNLRIKPKITITNAVGEIEEAIAALASSISDQIANAPPSLGIRVTEITGMLYYLTGNCHLEWS